MIPAPSIYKYLSYIFPSLIIAMFIVERFKMVHSFSPASCFSPVGAEPMNSNSSSSPSSSKMSQNLITCIYRIDLNGVMSFLTLTWSKTLLGQSLTIHLDGASTTIDISPPPSLLFFRPKHGAKSINGNSYLYWNFSRAQFDRGPEPTKNFYICLVSHGRVAFFLGDLLVDALQHTGHAVRLDSLQLQLQTLVSRREHVFGRRNYATAAEFGDGGRKHEIGIECSARAGTIEGKDAKLVVRVDGKSVLQVKRLGWKFRGNQRVVVDGSSVEIFWDVYNWLFNGGGHAVFIFQAGYAGGGGGGLTVAHLPELSIMKGPEKRLLRKSFSSSTSSANSVLQWAENVSESTPNSNSNNGGSPKSGFSLLLYAWRSDR